MPTCTRILGLRPRKASPLSPRCSRRKGRAAVALVRICSRGCAAGTAGAGPAPFCLFGRSSSSVSSRGSGAGLARTSQKPQLRLTRHVRTVAASVRPTPPRGRAKILDHLVVCIDRLRPFARGPVGRRSAPRTRRAPSPATRPAGSASERTGGIEEQETENHLLSVKNPGSTSSTPATRISAPWAIGPTGSPPVSDARPQPVERPQALPAHRAPTPTIARQDDDRQRRQQPDRAADLDEERDLEDRQPDEDQNEPQSHAALPFRRAVRWTPCPRDLT